MTKNQEMTRADDRVIVEFTLTDEDRALAEWVHITLDRPVAELQESVIVKANRTAQLRVEIGLEMLAIRNQCEYGEWAQWLKASGIDRERAAEAIRYVKFMSRLAPEERRKAMSLPVKKVYALATAEEEVLDEILSDEEEFDATTALSVSQMRAHIRDLEKQKHSLAVRLETAQIERDEARKITEPDMRWIPEVQQVRDEAMYFAGVVMRGLDDLDQVLTALGDVPVGLEGAGLAAGGSQHHAAAAAVYQAIAGPLGRVNQLLNRFREDLGLEEFAEDLPERLPVLSDVEAKQFYDNWKLMTRIAHSEKEERELERRRRAHRGKPGPKPGSKRNKG